jgi:hypothetical protein
MKVRYGKRVVNEVQKILAYYREQGGEFLEQRFYDKFFILTKNIENFLIVMSR